MIIDLIGDLFFERPERNVVPLLGKEAGQRSSPAPGTYYRNIAHRLPFITDRSQTFFTRSFMGNKTDSRCLNNAAAVWQHPIGHCQQFPLSFSSVPSGSSPTCPSMLLPG